MLPERTTIATIAIIGICPPSGVGAFIICIMIPKTVPANNSVVNITAHNSLLFDLVFRR